MVILWCDGCSNVCSGYGDGYTFLGCWCIGGWCYWFCTDSINVFLNLNVLVLVASECAIVEIGYLLDC